MLLIVITCFQKNSGYQNLIRKRKQEEERDQNTTKISKYFLALPSTSKESSETETSHFIDEGVIKSVNITLVCLYKIKKRHFLFNFYQVFS